MAWGYGHNLGSTEFSGGRITGPLLNMVDIGLVLFLVALVLTLMSLRIGAAVALTASLLCLPLYVYFTAPGPTGGDARRSTDIVTALLLGVSVSSAQSSLALSVPLRANYVWDRWSVAGIVGSCGYDLLLRPQLGYAPGRRAGTPVAPLTLLWDDGVVARGQGCLQRRVLRLWRKSFGLHNGPMPFLIGSESRAQRGLEHRRRRRECVGFQMVQGGQVRLLLRHNGCFGSRRPQSSGTVITGSRVGMTHNRQADGDFLDLPLGAIEYGDL